MQAVGTTESLNNNAEECMTSRQPKCEGLRHVFPNNAKVCECGTMKRKMMRSVDE